MRKNWLDLFQQNQLARVLESNNYTEKFGLVLNQQDAKLIMSERDTILKEQERIELGQPIISKIIYEFCDSSYIQQSEYVETLIKLQEIFYLYKNEMSDEITDDELLHFMKEQFESICYGDLEYLEGTVLNNFAQAVKAGYRDYKQTDGYGEYLQFDEVKRWDYELYLEALKELCWR